jgi:hypothetical protein
MTDDPRRSASPACFAHEADDAYMGFASKSEILAFLKAVADAERDGTPHAEMLRRMLPKVRDEALYTELKAKLDRQDSLESGT